MPKEDFLRVLDNIAAHTDPHKVFVILTGGEPLVREDLEDCGRAIYEKGFPWGMVTNGLYLTPERLERLLQAGMHTATVSLDGFKEEHNWMRGHPQSFDRATAAIRMLAALPGFVFDVVTCVNKHNYAYLEELKQYLIGIGLKRWRLFTVFKSSAECWTSSSVPAKPRKSVSATDAKASWAATKAMCATTCSTAKRASPSARY